jgi:hypothetical protein
VRTSLEPTDEGVPAEVLSRAITIGGRILLELRVQDTVFKAVVDDNMAAVAGQQMWVTMPASEMRLFGENDRVIDAGLAGA